MARDVGWSVIDTDYRYTITTHAGIDFNKRDCIGRERQGQERGSIGPGK